MSTLTLSCDESELVMLEAISVDEADPANPSAAPSTITVIVTAVEVAISVLALTLTFSASSTACVSASATSAVSVEFALRSSVAPDGTSTRKMTSAEAWSCRLRADGETMRREQPEPRPSHRLSWIEAT